MRKRPVALACALLLAGSAPSASPAQSLAGGTVRGSVSDEAGRPVFDATVTLTSAAAGFSRQTRTTREGEFAYRFTEPGEYVLLVEKIGYHPVRIDGIVVHPGHQVRVTAEIEPAPAGAVELRQRRFGGAGASAGQGRAVARFLLDALPDAGRDLVSVSRFATGSDDALGAAGLPGRWSALRVDGFPVAPASHPARAGAGPLVGLPLSWIAQAELVGPTADVGWGGAPGAYLDARTRPGTRELRVDAAGSWSSDALASSSHFEPEGAPFSTYDLRLTASGPIIPDTATFAAGLLARRLGVARAPAWIPGPWAADVADAAARAGFDATAAFAPRVAVERALGAFGRVDWRLGEGHALRLLGAWSSHEGERPLDPAATTVAPGFPDVPAEGGDVLAGAALSSKLGARVAQHLLVSFHRSEYAPAPRPGRDAAGLVTLLDEGITLGVDPSALLAVRHSAVHVEQTTHLSGASSHLQLGLQAGFWTHERDQAPAAPLERAYADARRWTEGVGGELRADGASPSARWNSVALGAFVQARWRAAPGLELAAGLRFDLETLPRGDVLPNADWLERTGLSNADLPGSVASWSPRLGLSWDIGERGEWFAHVSAGLHAGRIDPAVVGELLAERGTATVVRAAGVLGGGGGQPATGSATGRRLTLLGPDFAPPRALASTAGVTRTTAAGWSVGVSAEFRRTDFLPRRRNLNLLPEPVAVDQHGRPLHARLVQYGSLVVAEPGSEKRFSDFDVVSAIDADGRSEYGGVTFAVDGPIAPGVEIAASYTYSSARDDWPAGGTFLADRQLAPLVPGAGGADWRRGTADADAPHRLFLAAFVRVPLPVEVRLGAAYTYRSGFPFTPGFRPGVDANGDGSGRNDPAFVDDRIPGMDELLAAWPCLRRQAGAFAERNSCRSDAVHRLDLRVSARVAGAGGYAAALFLDAENLLEAVVTAPDAALYLVDASRSLEVDGATGTVTVPLAANPGFGRPLARHTTGRVLRIGLRLAF